MIYKIEMRKFAFTAQKIQKLSPIPHIHSHLELVFVKNGHSMVTLDNRQFHLQSGDVFLAFPNQLHFYHDIEPTEGYLFIFAPEILSEFKEIFHSKIPESPIWSSDELQTDLIDCFENISTYLSSGNEMDALIAKGYLLILIAEMFSKKKMQDIPGDEDTIKRILTYCLENYTRPLSLEVLSQELFLNKYYISHIFRDRMHISYKEFITRLRIDHACKLLKQNTSVTESAYASGFVSTKTFNRVFQQYIKMSPREYAKLNLQ